MKTTERTMTARYSGTCQTCGTAIRRGTTIIHAGRGNVRHEGCPPRDMSDPFARTASRGYYGRDRTRCEDAPCCGCC